MKIISKREHVTVTTHLRSFDYVGSPGSGFGFDCDKDGNPLPSLSTRAMESFHSCLTVGKVNGRLVEDLGVRTRTHRYSNPAVGECDCGAHVELYGFTNTCDSCGRDYNMSGHLLANRSQWGADTGESLADILAIP